MDHTIADAVRRTPTERCDVEPELLRLQARAAGRKAEQATGRARSCRLEQDPLAGQERWAPGSGLVLAALICLLLAVIALGLAVGVLR